jgi:hypothetical protein
VGPLELFDRVGQARALRLDHQARDDEIGKKCGDRGEPLAAQREAREAGGALRPVSLHRQSRRCHGRHFS